MGVKVLLPRSGADSFWKLINDHFAKADERKWRYLAMLALRENGGWPLDRIGNVFGHPKGHVTRCLDRIKQEIRITFEAEPSYEHHDSNHDEALPTQEAHLCTGQAPCDF